MVIRIVGQSRGAGEWLTYGDVANRRHNFFWNEEFKGYCLEVSDQQVISDIFKTQYSIALMPYKVEPVECPPGKLVNQQTFHVEQRSTAKIPPYVRPEAYANYPLSDLLLLCADVGFTPKGDVSNAENVRNQLDSAYVGVAWKEEAFKRLRAENESLKALVRQMPAKRGPKPKARQLVEA